MLTLAKLEAVKEYNDKENLNESIQHFEGYYLYNYDFCAVDASVHWK